jgi:bifunctional non-homologous end joining protein LigD
MRLSFIEPMLPTLVEEPPSGSAWIHEVKHDGYRTQLILSDGKAKAFTRRGFNWTEKYRPVVTAAEGLPARSAVLDGEMILPKVSGASDFDAFRKAIKGNPEALAFVAFDLLHLDGQDLRSLPLLERKARLWRLVEPAQGAIQYVEHVESDGREFLSAVDGMGLEGMVSKRAGGAYRSGRCDAWLKTKCFVRSELEVAAVLRGKPPIAYMVDGERRYVGGAFIALNREQREHLWSRVATKDGTSADGTEPLQPGIRGRVRHLRGEKELRHATLEDIWEVAPL